jgi:hypothetical protein
MGKKEAEATNVMLTYFKIGQFYLLKTIAHLEQWQIHRNQYHTND